MKAAVYYETGGPEVFRFEDVPDPECHPRGVVVEVQAVSIEGGDVLNRAGGAMPATPHIVGYQNAGVIREVGAEVDDREPGQRVVTVGPHGSHATLRSLPAASTWPVPDGLSIEQAATVPIAFGTADYSLFEFGRLAEGETALIQGGAGGVGLAAVQLAKRAGARVIATASTDDKLKRIAEFGVDEGINYAERDVVEAVMELTGGDGVDVVVDPVGGEVLKQSLACLGYRGRAITMGNASRGGREVDISVLAQRNRSLTGVLFALDVGTPRGHEMVAGHLRDVAAGELKAVVDRTFPLWEAVAAHAYIESRAPVGRVLLTP